MNTSETANPLHELPANQLYQDYQKHIVNGGEILVVQDARHSRLKLATLQRQAEHNLALRETLDGIIESDVFSISLNTAEGPVTIPILTTPGCERGSHAETIMGLLDDILCGRLEWLISAITQVATVVEEDTFAPMDKPEEVRRRVFNLCFPQTAARVDRQEAAGGGYVVPQQPQQAEARRGMGRGLMAPTYKRNGNE